MAKKKSKTGEKPEEILELEREYGVILEEIEFNTIKDEVPDSRFFSLRNQKVVAIGLIESRLDNIKSIAQFKDLEFLDLFDNEIEDISPLKGLVKLEELDLSFNKINNSTHLSELKNISRLRIYQNPVSDLNGINKLSKLSYLAIGFCNIHHLNFLEGLNQLVYLYCEENSVSDLSVLSTLDHLKRVDLHRNRINKIPIDLARKFKFTFNKTSEDDSAFLIINNPLSFPPNSVVSLGSDVTRNYYETSEQFGHAPLSEARIIVVGDGGSGKSSLIERSLYNTYESGKTQTNGIKIDDFELPHPEDKRPLSFHVWDFGGQEIQHAVHKFFFTEGCLYVLVLDSRKEEEPEYWLQQIESLGGGAPVLVVFNKQDENTSETVDRKFLKEKYPNIVDFYKTSCKTGFGISEFKKDLDQEVVKLRTVEEQFPNNWLEIKKAIEACTSGSQHYLTYEAYREICKQHHTPNEEAQKLLLKYFNTIGAITWFGDNTYLQFLHVLSPSWITQGVYKIMTAKKTALLFGQIRVSDFKELLQPTQAKDYTYDEAHYGYILSMMKRFDLCYTEDDQHLLIPSAFGKEPKVEYSDFKGKEVRTYVLQFKEYMPLALIHRFTKQRLADVLDSNYWYTGIVIQEPQSKALAMVHVDKEAKRIYVRIKGKAPLGFWEVIRNEFQKLASNYAKLEYDELVMLDEAREGYVSYEDLISYLQSHKDLYYHPKLQKDFNVGYLLGLFENKKKTLATVRPKGPVVVRMKGEKIPKPSPIIVNILNQNSAQVSAQVQVHIDIDIQVVHEASFNVQGEAQFLLEKVDKSNEALLVALKEVMQFAKDAEKAQNSGEVRSKGWGRKLKETLEILSKAGKEVKDIKDGKEALGSLLESIQQLASSLHLPTITRWFQDNVPPESLA